MMEDQAGNEKAIPMIRDSARGQGKIPSRLQVGNEDGWFVERWSFELSQFAFPFA